MIHALYAIVELFPGWPPAARRVTGAGRRATASARAWARWRWWRRLDRSALYVSPNWLLEHEIASSKRPDQ